MPVDETNPIETNPTETEPIEEPNPETEPESKPEGTPYTQKQLNSLMAKEKRSARRAMLKDLGFDIKDDSSFRDTMNSIKKILDSSKTQSQLDAEAKSKAETEKAEAEAKAHKLEMKVAALSVGANAAYLDDLITLASTRISDETSAEEVMKDLKSKYPSFFSSSAEEEDESSGTGHSTNHPNRTVDKKQGEMGKRLAKVNKTTVKSSYFNH